MNSVAIQAGGRSSRMGEDKGLVALGGRPMIAHVLDAVRPLAPDIFITTNNAPAYAGFGCRLVSDAQPGAGALPGLETALAAAEGTAVLVVACDMPFLNQPLLQYLLTLANEADVVVPRWDDRYQTLHAVYRRATCLAAVRLALAAGDRRMISFFEKVNVHTVPAATVREYDPVGQTFFNANTPQELAQAEAMIAQAE